MTDLLQLVSRQLDPRGVEHIGREIGAAPDATARAIETALPLLVGGLAGNANRSPQGAGALSAALERDHSPDLLEGLGSLLGGGGGSGGGGLGEALGGLLGGGGGAAGGALGDLLGGGGASGGGGGGLGDLLGSVLGGGGPKALDGAGILGHVFGNRRPGVERGVERASGLDGAQVGKLLALLAPLVMSALSKVRRERSLDDAGLAGYLDRERSTIERRTPNLGSGGLLGMLDRDDDGSIADDIAKIGVSLGGALLSARR